MKRCSKCKMEKDESEFYRDSKTRDGLQAHCKACRRLWEREYLPLRREYWRKEQTPSGRAKNSYWAQREHSWKRRGILSVNGAPFLRTDFVNYWEAQGGACAMCKKSFGPLPDGVRKANVDHWHKRGKYGPARALLCWLCNRRVGDLTYETAKPLWEYLSRFKPSEDGSGVLSMKSNAGKSQSPPLGSPESERRSEP